MGADVECRDGRLPPLRVRGAPLHGIDYELPVASAQVKSCLLLAGLLAEGETTDPRAAADAATTPSGCWRPPARVDPAADGRRG